MKKRTNSNIDLLKIICIIMIIAHHFVWDAIDLNIMDKSNLFYNFLYISGKLGVATFVIITGFFISKKDFEFKRILKLIIKVDIYSWALCLIYLLIVRYNISKIDLLKSFLPILFNRYWFATAYVILYFLSPYINKIIDNIDKSSYIKLLIILTVIIVILPTIGFNYALNNISALIYYYLIGAFIRKYNVVLFKKNVINLLMFMVGILAIFISTIIINYLASRFAFLENKTFYFTQINSLPVVFSGVSLFVFFSRVQIKYNSILSFLSAGTMGIYLIHDNYLIKETIFPYCFEQINNSNNLILYSLLFIFIVLIVLASIDYLISYVINIIIDKKKCT